MKSSEATRGRPEVKSFLCEVAEDWAMRRAQWLRDIRVARLSLG